MQPEQPRSLPELNAEQQPAPVAGIDTASANNDDIFLVKPPEKQPVDKKSVVIVSVLTFLGIIVLIGVLIFALISSANGLAQDYRRLAGVQLVKMEKPLKVVEPSLVFNKRDITEPLAQITLSKQSLPSLESVLFIGEWSGYYKSTVALQTDIGAYYRQVDNYTNDLQKALEFDAQLQEINTKEPTLVATIKPNDSLTVRSVSGSYDTIAEEIDSLKTGDQLVNLKKKLKAQYELKSSLYLGYAKAIEAKDAAAIEKAKAELARVSAEIEVETEDQAYVDAMTVSYKKVVNTQKGLLSRL